ncbi:hypothetical protein PAXRUDRAFT_20606 [Paxillus rubicundulus Ve08.2h10]|uniref:HTH CENPB-type domain-containing protein n=1 Tax=Paxillus rubicundulus Ve08.2h10 TaxID=930991 RepID=A0A0D0D1D3_9AGAM|nr:hypothetical protein PAXRUDRAFT_20606 [Paxillus rubicundulus Ve08.2h10]
MADHFNKIYPSLQLTQPLISSWVANEKKWWAMYKGSKESERSAKRVRQMEHPDVTEMLELWVSKAMEDGLILPGEVICQKWKQFTDITGMPDDERLNLSEGWLTSFKARNGLKNMKRHGEAASASTDTIQKERAQIQELIQKEGYELQDIFNADETALFYA